MCRSRSRFRHRRQLRCRCYRGCGIGVEARLSINRVDNPSIVHRPSEGDVGAYAHTAH